MKWYRVMPEGQLAEENARRVLRIGKKTILFIRHRGEVFAIENICPHWGFPLNSAKFTVDYVITCPFHRSAFDVRTGDAKEWSPWPPRVGPLLKGIRRKNLLPTYPTRVESGVIYVSVEDA